MTNAILTNVTYADLQAFLTPYHQRLHAAESFPPLNPNKAMHVAAKSMGLKDAHVMKAMMDANQASVASDEGAGNPVWSDDVTQFARLAAEISMAADGDEVDLSAVAESMDLDMAELWSLFARAEHAFEAIKGGALQSQQPEPKNDKVILLVFNEKEDGSGGSPIYTSTEIVKDWDKAKELIADRVHNKGMERADGGRVEELLEFARLCLPDEDDQQEIDMEDAESVLDWLIENNDVYELANYLEYLDYDLTSVKMDEKYLD